MRLGFWLSAMLLALAGTVPAAAAERPGVTIADGALAGVSEDGVRVFRAIPYAAPPVGERRWRAPEPPRAWQGVRDAATFGPACIQPPYPESSVYFEPAVPMSEDCLTLNVWTPEAAKDAPVILWLHGGALAFGTSRSPMYDGAAFAKRGVVFVSINYRLGVLGWLAHPALSAESPDHVSGNYGLLDQIAALQWVQSNIGAFGGDARNVTVMGESAGALSVAYLLGTPRAHGLFAKAIAQSPNIRAVPHLRDAAFGLEPAEETGRRVAEAAGAADLAGLRALDAKTLTLAALRARFTPQPTIDDWLFADQLATILERGDQTKVPILAGFNSGEVRSQRGLVPKAPLDAATYEAEIRRRYGDLASAWLGLYPASDMEGSLLAATRDAVYGWAAERLVRSQAAAGEPAYLYLFDHCYAAARARDLCAFHASELPFVFGRAGSAAAPPNWPAPEGAEDRALADAMLAYWVAFARDARSVASGTTRWPAYDADQAYMHFGAVPAVGHDPVPGMYELNEAVFERRRSRGEQWFLNLGPAAPLPDAGAADAKAPVKARR